VYGAETGVYTDLFYPIPRLILSDRKSPSPCKVKKGPAEGSLGDAEGFQRGLTVRQEVINNATA